MEKVVVLQNATKTFQQKKSSRTVRNYISEILQKLHVKNRIEAIKVAEEKGWN
ncbi:DNA-binding NarL/FixJ family response regulator [Bacillus chungangensis]|uniref:DNA-binding NarL/FixJ family response regulator n=1 Tax=Bacillus chungangensis TaxID=587633 RepID=A0ABT9WNB7_9BACI|nr:DNA-binding NarL/FixJ family response regulator [Bacillus chungangensis]